jgi:hypothetical protein
VNVVSERRNRRTGSVVLVVDNRDETFEQVGGIDKKEHDVLLADARWATVCQDHGNYCLHSTRKLADWFSATPDDWCGDCELLERRPGTR